MPAPFNNCVLACVNDLGCNSANPHCDLATGLCGKAPQTFEDQARSLVYRLVVNRALGVRRIAWSGLAPRRCFDGLCGGYVDLMGLVSDGNGPGETSVDLALPRPPYYTFKLLASRIGEDVAAVQGEVATGISAVHAYAYQQHSTGAKALIAWADDTTTTSLPWTSASAILSSLITDASGAPLRAETLAPSSQEVTLVLDNRPVWISPTSSW